MKKLALIAGIATLASPALAFAQETHEGHADHASEAQVAAVTDDELAEFVTMVIQGRAIEADAALSEDERQASLLRLIRESDMGLPRFTEVSQSIGADAALQQRVRSELARQLTQG